MREVNPNVGARLQRLSMMIFIALMYGGEIIMSEEIVKFRREIETLKRNLGVPGLSVSHSQTSITEAL